VGGGETGIVEEYLSRQEPAARGLIDRECLAELIGSYGTRWVDVLEYVEREPRLGQRVVPERPFILAQIHHAVEQEMATSVADVALRRTDLCNLGDRDGRITRAVAAEAQSVLNVSDEERQKQAQECLDQLVVEGLDLPDPHLFE
jgi:glycerol-3-phosphate dehydrogenase